MTPRDALLEDRRQAIRLVQGIGIDKTRALLRRAQAELERRLEESIDKGLGYTTVKLRQSLAQVRQVTAFVQGGVKKILLDAGEVAAEQGGTSVVRHLQAQEEHHAKEVGRTPLQLEEASIVDAAASGVRASILRRLASSGEPVEGADEEPHPAKQGILERYGLGVVEHFEDILQQGFVAQTPWDDMKARLVEASPFLRQAPAHWAERIVRTESMGILNRASWEANRAADDQLGDVVKILAATFDDRTSADSYAVHGQIRRPEEAFSTWQGMVQHPPARPNDREIMVTHRIRWPIPDYLKWRSDEEVTARWKAEGRKGNHPPRPKMTTVALGEFGKEQAAPAQVAAPEAAAIPPERFEHPAPPAPPRLRTMEVPQPFRQDQAALDVAYTKDQKVWDQDPDKLAALEVRARKKLKRVTGDKHSVKSPFEAEAGKPPTRDDADTLVYRRHPSAGRLEALQNAIPRSKVLVGDFVPGGSIVSRYTAENAILELSRNRGVFREYADERSAVSGAPILVRVGDKLYPRNPNDDAKMAAAKVLGLKTLDVHVVDANEHLAKEAEEHNAKAREKQEARDKQHEVDAERVAEEVAARVRKEHEGDPELVAVRAKHQPAEYAKAEREKYREAADSVGWGRAMMNRGLDFPISHLEKLAERFEGQPDHPFHEMASRVRGWGQKAKTLREFVESDVPTEVTRNSARAAAAILAHVDAIRGHEGVAVRDVHGVDRAHAQRRLDWMAELTDRSVTLPSGVHLQLAKDGRASCSTYTIQAWRDREARIYLDEKESAETVFHELGHAIEASDRRRGIRASAFLDARTAGDKTLKLHDLHPGSSYQGDEITRPDRFAHSYVGKDYGRERPDDRYFGDKESRAGVAETSGTHKATEVTSMAVQKLGATRGTSIWARAMDADPEHFLFGLGQLGGYWNSPGTPAPEWVNFR